MKALFLFLLLLNLLYALWQLQDGRATQAVLEAADSPERLAPLVAEPNSQAPVPEARPRAASAPLCVQLGSFAESTRAEQLRQRLLALGIQSEVVDRATPGVINYWLVMKIVGGRGEAIAQLSILQDRGIDSYLITDGRLADNISLGVFGREENARARRAQLRALGYPVDVESVEKPGAEYLVQIDAVARRLVDEALLARLRGDFPELRHQYHPCPGVPVGVPAA